jgi:hypothetical protein
MFFESQIQMSKLAEAQKGIETRKPDARSSKKTHLGKGDWRALEN